MPKKPVFIYCRTWSGEDSPSLEEQKQMCLAKAVELDRPVLGILEDEDLHGAIYPTGCEKLAKADQSFDMYLPKDADPKGRFRAGLGHILEHMSEVKGIIVYDFSRLLVEIPCSYLSRRLVYPMADANLTIYSLKEGELSMRKIADRVSKRDAKAFGETGPSPAEKTRQAMRRIRDDGYIPTVPKMFGIRYVGGPDREVEVISECVPAIRMVYDMVLARKPYHQILKTLNARFSVLVPGKGFYDSSWRHIIQQPFYCGYMYNSAGELIPAKQMAGKTFVTLEEWRQANAIVSSPRRCPEANAKKNAVHPFTGILSCGVCGANMVTGVDKGKEFYHCMTGDGQNRGECRQSRVTINLVRRSDQYTGLRESIAPLLVLGHFHKLEMEGRGPDAPEIVQLRTARDNTETFIRTVQKTLDDMRGLGSQKFIARMEERIESQQRKLRAQEEELQALQEAATKSPETDRQRSEDLAAVQDIMENRIDDETYRRLLRQSIRKIRCYQERIDIETIAGDFSLPRVIHKKFRNFPRVSWSIQPEEDLLSDLEHATAEIVYHSQKEDAERKLLADFPRVRIYLD